MESVFTTPDEALLQQAMLVGDTVELHQNFDNGVSSENDDSVLFHGFRIGEVGLLIPQNTASELFDNLSFCRLPKAAQMLMGVANIRGDIVPVFNLREIFSMRNSQIDSRWFLMIGEGDDAVAFCLDDVPVQIHINEKNRLKGYPALPENIRKFTTACYQCEGLWVECDLFQTVKSLIL